MPEINLESLAAFASAYAPHTAAAFVGYAGALVYPVSDLAVLVFRLAVKFPLVRLAIKKNPEAVKATIDAVEKALDAEVDAVAAEK